MHNTSKDEFSFFADEAYLVKSGDAKSHKFGGCFTTEDRDIDGEILDADGMDITSYFMNGWGKIKYEHPDYLDTFIGAPTKVWRNGKKTYFEAEFYHFHDIPDDMLNTQQKAAKQAYDLLKNTEEWNRLHPEAPKQKIGYSVEGEWRKKDKDEKTGRIKKSRLVNVVLTTKPRNRGTEAVLKSMEVGYAHGITDQTGFGATRLSSIQRDKKQIKKSADTDDDSLVDMTESINNSFIKIIKEHIPMKKFKDKKECHEYYKSLGLDDDEAGMLADKWEKHESGEGKEKEELERKKKEEAEKNEKVEKSLGISDMRASLEAIQSLVKARPSFTVEEFEGKLSKSVKVNAKGEVEDITPYFKEKEKMDIAILETLVGLNDKLDLFAKSMGLLVAGTVQMAKSVGTTIQFSELNAKAAVKMLKSSSMSLGLSTDNLDDHTIDDNNRMEKSLGSDLKKGEVIEILDKLRQAGKVDRLTVSRAEVGEIDDRTMQMVKSNRNLLHK
jgi:hypothetical protein